MYCSQLNQDRILNELFFKNKKNGFYLDVGAHDGLIASNTYFFEKCLEWNGICIEPLPNVFDLLVKNRNSININACAYNDNRILKFNQCIGYTEMLSGIVDTYNPQHSQRIDYESKIYNCTNKIIEVQAFRLEDLLTSHQIKIIDYLSLDVEGSELQVLEGIDFGKVHINVMTVEMNYPNSEEAKKINNLLLANNFTLHSKIVIDYVYINNNLKYSWC